MRKFEKGLDAGGRVLYILLMDAATKTAPPAPATHMLVDACGNIYCEGSHDDMLNELRTEHDADPERDDRMGYAVVPVTAHYWIPPYPHHRCPRGWYSSGDGRLWG